MLVLQTSEVTPVWKRIFYNTTQKRLTKALILKVPRVILSFDLYALLARVNEINLQSCPKVQRFVDRQPSGMKVMTFSWSTFHLFCIFDLQYKINPICIPFPEVQRFCGQQKTVFNLWKLRVNQITFFVRLLYFCTLVERHAFYIMVNLNDGTIFRFYGLGRCAI